MLEYPKNNRIVDFFIIVDNQIPEGRHLFQAVCLIALEAVQQGLWASKYLSPELSRLLYSDEKNVVLEVRAGTGGDEAALFAASLFRMYAKYAEMNTWRVEVLGQHPTGVGGFKEIIALIEGKGVYRRLKYESGVHRVQRVPITESQGRIHTSTVTVAVLPEAEEVEVEIDPKDLKIDVYRSSGPGGQHVNTTDSAVRITHIPTGTVVACQDERSQLKNKEKAMKILRSRILAKQQEDETKAKGKVRKLMVGSGDRSEKIRTYNFSQDRVTDHRIHLTLHNIVKIMDGDLDKLISALKNEASKQESWIMNKVYDVTITEALKFATKELKKSKTPALDAEVLLIFVLKKDKTWLFSHLDGDLSPKLINKYKNLIFRRKKEEPIAYITHHKEFFGLDFYIDESVLIPRPETELLVEETLKFRKKGARILDLGTGSGCIIVAIAVNSKPQHQNFWCQGKQKTVNKYYATDISSKALEIAQKNAKKHKVLSKIKFIKSDLFVSIPKNIKFDIIIANLPYLNKKQAQKASLSPEPQKALDGGKDGLRMIGAFLNGAKKCLKRKAIIIFEIDPGQKNKIKGLAKSIYPHKRVRIKKDLAGLERMVILR